MARKKKVKKYLPGETPQVSDYILPMLAKETEVPFNDKDWIFEIKWDGYRAIAEVEGNSVKLYSRNGNSFNKSYPVIVDALAKMNIDAVLDGEVVAMDKNGVPSFQLLQHYNYDHPLLYYVFDVLYINKKNICSLSLLERKKRLKKLLKKNDFIKYADHIEEKGIEFFKLAIKNNLEGIMAKRAHSEYLPGVRTSSWLKIKHHKTIEAIIAGFTAPGGSRLHLGSLVLAVRNGNKLKYIGQTGTGFNSKTLKEVYELLKPLVTKESAFDESVKIDLTYTPVKPVLVCEVKYSQITQDGKLRHPVFLRLRDDKKATDVTGPEDEIKKKITKAKPNPTIVKTSVGKTSISEVIVEDRKKEKKQKPLAEKAFHKKKDKTEEIKIDNRIVKISNTDKIFWPVEGLTKGDVIDYYIGISDYILPYLKGRPESLKRNPNGILESSFFHKDAAEEAPEWVDRIKIFSESADKEINFIICNNAPTLIYLANLGCIELNPWHSTVKALDNPDYLVIDIDPSEKNTFDEVIEVALKFKELFDKAGAESYCKTSGATGMHVYVPMEKKYSYEQVLDFAHLVCIFAQTLLPSITSLERSLAKRNKKHIYLDYMQNRRGQTIAAPYCLRPKTGAPVSMPLKWAEVKNGLSPKDFNIHNALKRLKKTGDIFSGILGKGINMEKCIESLNN